MKHGRINARAAADARRQSFSDLTVLATGLL
jgi:hypothetical protein